MGCGCGKDHVDAEERVFGVLDEAGLRAVGEQTLSIRPVVAESVRALNKADRAAALNLGVDVVRLYRAAGERATRPRRRSSTR